MTRSVSIPLLIAAAAIAAFILVSSTITSVLVFIPGVIISLIVYFITFFKKVPDPERLLPLYLFALGIQFIHFTEEYLTGFIIELPKVFGQEPYPQDYWVSFNMVAYFVFILGGIVLFKKAKAFTIIPLFFILVGVLFNGVVHIITALYVGGYFPGLYTAFIYIIIGPILLKRILNDSKIDTDKGNI